MFRCVFEAAWPAAVGTVCLALSMPAVGQPAPLREFPAVALRGELMVTQPPAAMLNGKPAQLAPGARIRDQANIIQLSGALSGRKLLVHYTTDLYGQVLDVWVLRPQEAANKPWPATRDEAAAWSFDATTQTWTKP